MCDATSRASLRTALWALRRALGDAAGALHADRDEIGLNVAATWVDLREFASLAGCGDLGPALEQRGPGARTLVLRLGERKVVAAQEDVVVEEAQRLASAMRKGE